jgi:hypothetical protein
VHTAATLTAAGSIFLSTAVLGADYRAEPHAPVYSEPQAAYAVPLPREPQVRMGAPRYYVQDVRSGYNACGCEMRSPFDDLNSIFEQIFGPRDYYRR